jgi:hypothetical protein
MSCLKKNSVGTFCDNFTFTIFSNRLNQKAANSGFVWDFRETDQKLIFEEEE